MTPEMNTKEQLSPQRLVKADKRDKLGELESLALGIGKTAHTMVGSSTATIRVNWKSVFPSSFCRRKGREEQHSTRACLLSIYDQVHHWQEISLA